jgi:RNase H-fold protein (predicted Holliday junction resolvase)
VTILGLDVGERRIGVALAEDDGHGVRPLVTLRRARTTAEDATELGTLIGRHRATEIVVGLLAAREVSIAWTWQDERLTSHLAEGRLGPMRRGRSGGPPSKTQRDAYRARVDREAAAIILEDALTARRLADHSMETGA